MDARAHSSSPASREPGLRAWSALQIAIVALALAGPCAATAYAQAEGDAAAGDATRISSEQSAPTGFRFDLDKLDLNIFGLSYHPDREKVKRENLDNQVNPGLGLHYEFRTTERDITFAEIGAYRDSGRNLAKYMSLGYQLKLGERWKIGGAVAAVNSPTYNNGVSFVGMFPLITYDMGPVKLNLVYFPKVANYNEVAAYGFYISIPLGHWLGDSARKQ